MADENLFDFFRIIDSIKHKERQGWEDIGKERPLDTIASHFYGTALLGWYMAEEQDMDIEKTIKALLVHDLIMAYIPDYTPEEEGFDSKKEFEREKRDELLEQVPENIRGEVADILEELQQQESEFYSFVKEVDKIETLMQSLMYSEELGENHSQEFLESYRSYLKSDQARDISNDIERKAREKE